MLTPEQIKALNYRKLIQDCQKINNPDLRAFIRQGIDQVFELGDGRQLRHGLALHSYPVHPEEFLFGQRYLARPRDEMYPEVVKEIININDGRGRVMNTITELVATGGIGSAKCLGRDTPVLMFDGTTKAVQDVLVGDLLMGPDSCARKVVSLASGMDQLYRVDQKAGMPYVVNSEHILSLQYTNTSNGTKPSPRYGARKGDVRNLSVQEYLSLTPRHRSLLKGWRPKVTTFKPTYVSDPYLLGLWLGDGTSADTSFTSMDNEIAAYLQVIADRDGLALTVLEDKRGNKAKRYALRGTGSAGDNRVRTWLQSYGLLGNKHVPHAYLVASVEDRLQLLAGLLDTDGSLNGNGYVISQGRKNLADSICFLARSLGFTATQKVEPHPNGTTYYRTFINGHTDAIPVRIAYKKAALRKQEKDVTRWGVTVTPLGEGEYFGFELEGPDRLFLLGDFTVTHNTTTALYTIAYQLYLLSCYKNPHTMFQMDSTSEILFIFQSMNATLGKEVDYKRFRSICEQSYYFTSVFPFRKDYESSLIFPNRIECKPIGSDGGAIGQNVLGGLIDEVNFMAVVEESKKNNGRGTYDQAKAIYDSVSRRIKTRFVNSGGMAGILCLVSSKNYPGEFTDTKLDEAKSDETIYIYDKRVWEVKPAGTFSGVWFKIFTGDETRKPRILDDQYVASPEDEGMVLEVPIEYKQQFERDMIGSLRDIAGVSTMARFPFILNADAIAQTFSNEKSILSKAEHDFTVGDLEIFPGRFKDLQHPRWVHIDLSITGDSAGVSCGYVPGFELRKVGDVQPDLDKATNPEFMPVINLDFVLRVMPPRGSEIKFFRIRDLLHALKKAGLPIKWVSFDSFQSVDSVQLLRQGGFSTGYISVDTSTLPYEMTKQAMYDGRLNGPVHRHVQREFLSLEKNVKKNKIDHPPAGSKDCSDAVAGVVYGLSTRKEVWMAHGIHTLRVPENIRQIQEKASKSTATVKDTEDELEAQRVKYRSNR